MWMIFILILLVFLLLSPVMMVLFPLLLLFLPVLLFAGRPSVKVYTRTFGPQTSSGPLDSPISPNKKKDPDPRALPDVIDVEYTEHKN